MRLNRDVILAAAISLVEAGGSQALSARRLGEALGADPSSLYRHFDGMADLERAVGDRLLAAVDVDPRAGESWRSAVTRICTAVRAVQLAHPRLATLVQSSPTRLANELRITEALLRELARAGLRPERTVAVYHAVVELTVGSAAIDAALAAQPVATRTATYRAWRRDYEQLDEGVYPTSVVLAAHMYRGTADDRFQFALSLMLDPLAPGRDP